MKPVNLYCFFIFFFLLHASGSAALPQCPQAEMDALNLFYSNTQPWNNFDSQWATGDCCQREGIACNSNYNVISINASVFGLYSVAPVAIDFTALSYLEDVLFGQLEDFGISSLLLPQTVKILDLKNTGTSTLTTVFDLPNLEKLFLSDYGLSEFQFPNPVENLIELYLIFVFYVPVPTDIPNVEALSFLSDGSSQPLTDVCSLAKLKQLTIYENSFTFENTLPACLVEKPLVLLNIFDFYLAGPFPTLSDTIQSLALTGIFENIPEQLPASIINFQCKRCFLSTPQRTIPDSWLQYGLLGVDISNNDMEGLIPAQFIETLYFGNFASNMFTNDMDDFLAVRDSSYWSLEDTWVTGVFSDDYKYHHRNQTINFSNIIFNGYIPRYAYCLSKYFDVVYSPQNLAEMPGRGSEMDKLAPSYINLLVDDGSWAINKDYYGYFCNGGYQDPAVIPYLTPIPSNGGSITILTTGFPIFPMAAQLTSKKNTTAKRSLTSMAPTTSTIASSSKEFNINFNGVDSAGSSPYDNIWTGFPSTPFDAFQFFEETYGQFFVGDEITDQIIATLRCQILTLEALIECVNYPKVNLVTHRPQILFQPTGGGINTFYFNEELDYIEEPVISNVQVDTYSDLVTVTGQNFGDDYRTVASIQYLADGIAPVVCEVISKNSTTVICQRPDDVDDSQVFNLVLKINGQEASVMPTPYNPAILDVPSDCYGTLDVPCQGNGQCSPSSGTCICADGYQGLYCDTKTSQVSTPGTPLVDDGDSDSDGSTQPIGNFDPEGADVQYIVNVVEIREVNVRGQVVKKFTPSFPKPTVSSDSTQYLYKTPLTSESELTVTLTVIDQPQVISWANATIQTDPGTLKYTVSMSNYPFASVTNSMQIVFNMQSQASSDLVEKCGQSQLGDSTVQTDPNVSDLKWVQISRGNTQMLGKIINRSVIDARIVMIRYTTEYLSINSMNLVANVPYFATDMTIDPSYSVLINPSQDAIDSKCKSNKWKIAVGVTVGVVGTVALAVGAFILYKKKVVESAFKNKLKQVGIQ